MHALTAQSIRRLCGRLEVMQARGPMPALMSEYGVDAPEKDRRPLPKFDGALRSGSLRELPSGRSSRSIWLDADPALVAEFRDVCKDAARVAVPALHAAGYHVGLGTTDLTTRWLWAVFELAELRLPGTFLRLDGDRVYRLCDGDVTVGEEVLSGPPLFAELAATAGATRYRRLADAITASLAVLDIIQIEAVAPPSQPPETGPESRRRSPPRSTRKIDVDHYLGRLEAKMRKKFEAEYGSAENTVMEAMVRDLYSLSAEDLVDILRTVGYRGSSKTISRPGNSKRYESWKRYRRGGAKPSAVADPTRKAGRGKSSSPADSRLGDAVDRGSLSLRAGGRGTTRTAKTATERAAEEEADRFAREAGVELPRAE